MPSGTITKKRRGAATLALLGTAFSGTAAPTAVAMLAAAAGSVVLAEAANAAVITGAVKTMQIVETTVAQGQRVTVNGTWAVPDSAKAGDTFTFQMPGAIFSSILTPSIQLLDVSGQVAANCTTSGLTMTCTLTNYVDQNANVHGTFRFQATVSKDAPVKDNTPITMTGSGGTFTDTIDVTEAKGGGLKVMGMDQSDNNNDGITDQLFWKIETDPLVGGPGTVVVNDTPVPDDMVLLCGDIKVFKNGTILAKTAYTMTCSATGLKITIPGVANNSVIRVTGYANFVGPHTPGRIFTNNATVSAFGTTVKGAANFVYPEGGGTADGDQWVAVGDTVKEDVNNNGIQDTGDLPMQGVTLTLSRSDGKPVVDYLGNPVTLTQKTDANGHYLFDELSILPAGVKYQVAVTTPAGYAPAKTGAGTSQTDYNNPKATAVELTALGDEDLALDFGFVKIPPPAAPEIDIEKLGGPAGTTAEDADTPETAVTLPNGTANIDFVVTNTGNEGLKNVTVTDALISGPGSITGLSCTFPDGSTGTTWAGPLAVGDSFPCTAQLAGVTPGSTHLDTATVTGVGVTSNTTVTDEDDFNAIRPELPVPGIDIEKEGNAAGELPVDADTAAEAVVLPDGTANIIFTVTNTGAEALEDVTVSDAVISGPAKVEGLECTFPDDSTGITWAGPFAIGDSFTCTAQLSGLTPGASHLDTATVTGTGVVSGNDVTDKDDFNATRDELPPVLVPEIDIEKLGNVAGSTPVDADTAAEAVTLPDGTGQITFEITNNGEEALKDIAVTDAVISGPATVDGLECTFPDDSTGTTWAGPFAVGDTFTCTASLSGLTAGSSHLDTATVTGVGVTSGTTVTDKDDFNAIRDEVPPPPVPEIDIEKLGGPAGTTPMDADTPDEAVVLPDGTAEIHFLVTNTGMDELKDVTVSDAVIDGPATVDALECTFPDGTKGTTWAGPLAVGDTFECSAQLSGLTPGSNHLDTASVSGTGVLSDTEVTDEDNFNAIRDVVKVPSIDIEKLGGPEGTVALDADTAAEAVTLPDGTAQLSFVVTNNGDEDLKAITVSDELVSGPGKIESLSCTFPDGSTGLTWDGPLASGDSFPCTASLTGVTPGSKHLDTATVVGVGVDSGTDVTDSDDFNAITPPKPTTPSVDVEKTDEKGNDADTADDAANLGTGPGSVKIVETFTNNGTEPLKDVVLTETNMEGGTVTDFICTLPDGTKLTGKGPDDKPQYPTLTATWAGPWAPGETIDCTAMLTGVTGKHKDVASVTATGATSGTPVKDDDEYHAVVEYPKPAISIVKKMNGKDADTAETAVNLGDGGGDGIGEGWVDYTVSAPKSNTEGIVLDAKSVWDVVKANGKLKDFVCELPKANGAGKIILKPGQSFDCKGYLYDIKAGSVHKDIGYVKGVGENSGIEVSDDNPLHVVVSKPDTPPIIDTGAGAGYSSGAGIDGWLLGSGLGLMALAGVGGAMAYRRKKAVNEMSPAA